MEGSGEGLLLVQLVHGHLYASEAEGFDGGRGFLGAFGDEGFLFGWELSEDIVHLLSGEEVVTDAKAEAGVLLCA